MKINSLKQTSFGYKSILKSQWLKGNMPSVTKGIYGGILSRDNITLEHIIPHSKGGKTRLDNLALAVDVNNCKRSSKPLSDCFDEAAFEEYIEQFRSVDLPGFCGIDYIKAIRNTLKRIL